MVGVANIRFKEPRYSLRKNCTNAFSARAFWRKYPADRISDCKGRKLTCPTAAGVNTDAALRLARASSTFLQEVFWVRIAPIMISKGVSPGHQCCGPNAVNRALKYSSRGGCASAFRALIGFPTRAGSRSHFWFANGAKTGRKSPRSIRFDIENQE